jgi:hypothetical protein
MKKNIHCFAVTDLPHGVHIMPKEGAYQIYVVGRAMIMEKLRYCLRHSFAWLHWHDIKRLLIADREGQCDPSVAHTSLFTLWVG